MRSQRNRLFVGRLTNELYGWMTSSVRRRNELTRVFGKPSPCSILSSLCFSALSPSVPLRQQCKTTDSRLRRLPRVREVDRCEIFRGRFSVREKRGNTAFRLYTSPETMRTLHRESVFALHVNMFEVLKNAVLGKLDYCVLRVTGHFRRRRREKPLSRQTAPSVKLPAELSTTEASANLLNEALTL